jgi:alpha-mannosidase
MLPRNPLPQLIPGRVAGAIQRLDASIWHDRRPVSVEATPATAAHRGLAAARREPRRPVRAGETWGRLFDQRWCRVTLTPPADGQEFLEWGDQGEATLYVEGEAFFGFDVAHRRVALPRGTREVWVECHCVQSAIWHPAATGLSPRGSVFGGAWRVRRDDDAWHAWLDLQCLTEALALQLPGVLRPKAFGRQAPIEACSPLARQLLGRLDGLIDALDTGGAAALRRAARAVFAEFRRSRPELAAILTGHAHLDLVWLWPERTGEAKAVHTFANVDRLLATHPEVRFAYSQPASYAAVERLAPGLMRRVRGHLRAGRWEATGALYVESDTLLACGEALARSFTCGQEDFQRLRGAPAKLVWLPDVFGYSGCLPQLMKLAGVGAFFTTKLTWNAVNRFPFSSFVWRGNDGSEVVAHTPHEVGYNNVQAGADLQLAGWGHVQADVHPEFLHPTGYGDGGGGPTEEMAERARRLDALAGLPRVRWDQPEAFFARLARLRARLPVHQGECYLEYHRGTFTTHGAVKAAFRALEVALQAREAAAVLAGAAPDLGAAWRRLVFAQFHDFIPGSSVPEVYAEGGPELRRLAAEQLAGAAAQLRRGRGVACVFNPVPEARTVWHDGDLLRLPALAGVARAEAVVADFTPVTAGRLQLGNGRLAARFDARGGLVALVCDGRPLALRPGAGELWVYPDRAANFEAWDVDRGTLALGEPVRTPARVTSRRDPRGRWAELAFRRRVGRASTATVRYRLEAEADVLRVDVELDWREPETLLKYVLPTAYAGQAVRCGAPFGTVWRPQQPGANVAEAMWEIPFSRHLTVTDDGGRTGLTVLTQDKYGASVRDGVVGVSLVRSPRITGFDTGHLRVYPPGLSRLRSESIYSDQGAHTIRLALAGYVADAPRAAQPAARADALFAPVLDYRGAPAATAWEGLEGGETLVPCWAQPAGRDAWVLRLHETGGERGVARVCLAAGWRAEKIDLRGKVLARVPRDGRVEFRPHEIIGLRLRRGRAG